MSFNLYRVMNYQMEASQIFVRSVQSYAREIASELCDDDLRAIDQQIEDKVVRIS